MDTDAERIPVESTLKELHAYAKLLFLRSGRQFKDKVSFQELEEDISPDECSNDNNSSKNAPLGDFDEDQLGRKFLDRLSETVSSMKGGRHVVASCMFYWPDKVKVFVAINSGFVEGDALSKFLDNLCTSLKVIAVAPDNETEKHMDALWDMLLHHQSSRLHATIVDLRQIMKDFQHLRPQRLHSKSIDDGVLPDIDGIILDFEGCLKLLAQLLFGNSDSDLERHNSLVALSHALYRNFPAEKFHALGRQGEKLHREIGFLGRLQTSLHVFVAAARQITSFENLSLIPVVKSMNREKPSNQEWSLVQTFHALKIPLSDTAVEKLMQPSTSKNKWTKNKLITDFSRLKSPTWEVHAEIQLIVFALGHPDEIANGKRFDYIGCSRYICLQCSKFLQYFPGLKSRGCHGKLYNHSWTLPLGDSLGKDGQQSLYRAAREVTSWMRRELVGRSIVSHHRKPEVKESTIGGSLVSMFQTSQEGHQQSHTILEHLRRQRAEVFHESSSHRRLLNSIPDEEISIVEAKDATFAESTTAYCTACCQDTTRRCSYCRQGPFCNESCERRMPLSHLLKCNMRQVTSADYLYQDVLDDRVPTDPQVCQDYWFDRCQSSHEESHLLGLFAGLLYYHHHPTTREGLHQWRSDAGGNTYLVKRIFEKFEELPKGSMGSYFPWFLRYRNRFELPDGHKSIPQRPSPEMQVKNMQERARRYLAPEDQNKDFKDLCPFSKMHCFAFYSIIMASGYLPPVNRDVCHWFDFGFVVCKDQHEEESLCRMYHTMLFGSLSKIEYEESLKSSTPEKFMDKKHHACTFEEFWKTWERGNLMAIFNRCWPVFTPKKSFQVSEYDLPGSLRVFFETEAPRPSIWKLRHFLAMEDVSVESAVPELAQAAKDYGFSETLDTRTAIELRKFYMQLFKKVQPLEIHSDRMKGILLQFAERHVGSITLRVKKVLQSLE